MGQLEDLARASEPTQKANTDQLRELRKANEHLREIRKWAAFLGWMLLLFLIGGVVKFILDMLKANGWRV